MKEVAKGLQTKEAWRDTHFVEFTWASLWRLDMETNWGDTSYGHSKGLSEK